MNTVRECILVLALAALPFGSAARSQVHPPMEVPHSVEAPHLGEEDRKTSESTTDREKEGGLPSGTFHMSREEFALFTARRHPPVTIYWKKTMGANHQIKYDAYRQEPGTPPPGIWVDSDALMAIQKSNEYVVHTGEIPSGPQWRAFTSTHSNAAIHLEGSQNNDPQSITLATALGTTSLHPGTTRIFNALPHETNTNASLRERQRMGLDKTGTAEAWKSVNDGIHEKTEGYETTVATRKALLEELQHGSSDVILIYAHFDGQRLHLPGEQGTLAENTISINDLAKVNRVGDKAVKDRIIVLAACSTASPVNGQSLAQVLLKNGIARTVFATDRPYDAREIPDLMSRLRSTSVRSAGGQLHQYVELKHPLPFTLGETSSDE